MSLGLEPRPDCTPAARRGEISFVIIVLLLSMGAFQNLLVGGGIQGPNTGMLGMAVVWSCLYVLTLIFFFGKCHEPLRTIWNVFPLLTLTFFVAASVFWSEAPLLTARRSIALVLTLVFGVYFGSRFETKRQFRLLVLAFAICVVFSFAFELLGLNPDPGFPGWYGIFYQKNSLGRIMVLGALIFLLWKRAEPEYASWANLGFVAAVILVFLSRSASSLLVLILLVLLLSYLQWSLKRGWLLSVSGIIFLVGMTTPFVLWASTHLEAVAGGLGKDPLLTGRVPLWILSAAAASQRPWFGFGYEAFWRPEEVYVRRIWRVLAWAAPHAHNGFLELWLDLGLLGLTLFLIVLFYYVVKALKFSYVRRAEPVALWPLMFLVFMLIGNLTEVSFLSANSVSFILYVSISSMLASTDKGSCSATASSSTRYG
jgi:exopolysaccharide production protein ExoQ